MVAPTKFCSALSRRSESLILATYGGGPVGPFGLTSQEKGGHDGYDDDDHNRDSNRPSTRIGFFSYRTWLDQAAHASRLYSGR